MEISERRCFEGLDKIIKDNLSDTSTVRKASDEDWTVELRGFVEVKLYWVSHGRRGRTGRSILEIGEGSTD